MKSNFIKYLLIIFSPLIIIVLLNSFLIKKDYREVFSFFNKNLLSNDVLRKEGIDLIIENKNDILISSKEFNVDPIAIAGIILSENILNKNVSNHFEDYYVKNFLLVKPLSELEKLYEETKATNTVRDSLGLSNKELGYRSKNGLIWSLGLCQISILKAMDIENELSVFDKRKKRNIKEVISALLQPNENIRYCAFEFSMINKIYKEIANLDISKEPEIMATLYNTGNVYKKAISYKNGSNKKPATNIIGEFVLKNKTIIKTALN